MDKLIWIQMDDWNAIYFNNLLGNEGHRIDEEIWWGLAQKCIDMNFEDIKKYWISDEDFFDFPNDFNEIDKSLLEEL